MLDSQFFARDACQVARELLGKVLRRRHGALWLEARIIEAEAYYRAERASHSSLGWSRSRRAMFMEPGTIYMYYSRGGPSLNVSCAGEGDAVLIKSGVACARAAALAEMLRLNPKRGGGERSVERLCSGQTLLARALDLRVDDWNARPFDAATFHVADLGYRPEQVVRTRRLGIPQGRDEHLLYRFVDRSEVRRSTSNPLTRRGLREGRDYQFLTTADATPPPEHAGQAPPAGRGES